MAVPHCALNVPPQSATPLPPPFCLFFNVAVHFSPPFLHTIQTGFGYSAGFDVSAGMLIIQTLSNQFPERLNKIVMTNTPFVFNAFWALVKVFLDERTSQKVVFCKQEEIPEKTGISLENLPPFLGGSSSYVFSPEHVADWVSVVKGPMPHLPRDLLERAWEGAKPVEQ